MAGLAGRQRISSPEVHGPAKDGVGHLGFDRSRWWIGRRSGSDTSGRKRSCFDNEVTTTQGLSRSLLLLADRVVTCDPSIMAFMTDGGYQTSSGLWLSDGWAWVQSQNGVHAPLYWSVAGWRVWFEYRLSWTRVPVRQGTYPLTHVSFYEADAYRALGGVPVANAKRSGRWWPVRLAR